MRTHTFNALTSRACTPVCTMARKPRGPNKTAEQRAAELAAKQQRAADRQTAKNQKQVAAAIKAAPKAAEQAAARLARGRGIPQVVRAAARAPEALSPEREPNNELDFGLPRIPDGRDQEEDIFDPSSRRVINRDRVRQLPDDLVVNRRIGHPPPPQPNYAVEDQTRSNKRLELPIEYIPPYMEVSPGARAGTQDSKKIKQHMTALLNRNTTKGKQTGGVHETRSNSVAYPSQLRSLWRLGLGRDELDLLNTEDFSWVETERKRLYSWIMRAPVSSITTVAYNERGEEVEAISLQEKYTIQRSYCNVMMVTFRRKRRYDDRKKEYVAVQFDAKVEPYHSCALIVKYLNWVIACDEGRQSRDNRELKYSLTHDALLEVVADLYVEVMDLQAWNEGRQLTLNEVCALILSASA